MIWTAGFRTAVISPYEEIRFSEPRGFADQTLRQRVHLAGGGERVRVRLSNRYGRAPLTIAAATAAVGDRRAALTFDGADKLVVPPGEEAVSDPADLPASPGDDLLLALYLPEETGLATYSHMALEYADVAAGDHTGAAELPGAERIEGRFLVAGVDVLVPDDTPVIVAFGDSWFEGVGTTPGANRRSVDFLNRRLARGWAVNLGIAGNRLLRDGVGEHALGRFDRDVLSIGNVTDVLVHLGVNDLVLPRMYGAAPETAEALIDGFTTLARRAHEAGLRIHVATLGPFAGTTYEGLSTPEGLAARRAVNDRLRGTDVFDSVFDVARAVEDPDRPDRIRADLDSGDGLHLNDEGTRIMAETVDLDALAAR